MKISLTTDKRKQENSSFSACEIRELLLAKIFQNTSIATFLYLSTKQCCQNLRTISFEESDSLERRADEQRRLVEKIKLKNSFMR